ncbi:hypothetical protein NTGM5_550007 [Candidatus Nitrotoga sp. M5]|nr:hypothetical protein NTGM5_550007 [Candidatus Nitrotoga sp. M5]
MIFNSRHLSDSQNTWQPSAQRAALFNRLGLHATQFQLLEQAPIIPCKKLQIFVFHNHSPHAMAEKMPYGVMNSYGLELN